jgi:catechol 2,3-dioxygenase-like lactoylglutathione lyase family enzyme
MRAEKLDHVALFVTDPEAVAARILAQLPYRIIEETDEFVLVGRGPELGKLTLFGEGGPRERGVLKHVGIGIPGGTEERTRDVGEGLELSLVPSDPEGDVDLHHVAFVVVDPERSARSWLEYGFEAAENTPEGVRRVRLGDAYVELHPGSPTETDQPLFDHLGLLVESVEDVYREVEGHGYHVNRTVDGEDSRAVFLRGPDGIELEYIEHKPSFALA